MRLSFFALCSLAFITFTSAQDEAGFDPLGENVNRPKLVRVMIEYIELPLPELAKLLANPRKSANDNDLREAVGKLVTAGTAKHHDTQLVIARSGETASSEGILEYIYPTEYEPFTASSAGTSSETSEKKTSDSSVIIPPTPTAFETRNTGGTMEIQPTIGASDHVIDLRLAPEIVQHVKNEFMGEWKGADGEVPIQMPLFFSSRINTGLTMISGQYSLASTTSMLGDDQKPDHQRKLLFFIRADVLTVGL